MRAAKSSTSGWQGGFELDVFERTSTCTGDNPCKSHKVEKIAQYGIPSQSKNGLPNPRFEVEVERGERGCGAGCVACQSPGDACKVGPMWCGGVNNAMQTPNCTKVVLFVLCVKMGFLLSSRSFGI